MPRYAIDDAQRDDLAAYLHGLSARAPPGLDGERVRVATITTPDVEPQRRDAMLATLKRFVAQKNGQSRHEANRSMQSQRTREMVMYRKYRVWDLEHWPLSGPPAGWGAQLDAYQAARPVYAVVAGAGAAEWAPVDAFCARQRVPACCRWWTSAPRPRASTACTTTRAWMRTRARAPARCAPAACGA
jgi:hypothetical protein